MPKIDRLKAAHKIRLHRCTHSDEVGNSNINEENTMRYIQPKITGTFSATSTIKSAKIAPNSEVGTNLLTDGNAYQADE